MHSCWVEWITTGGLLSAGCARAHRRPFLCSGTYEFDEAAPGGDLLEGEYLKLAAQFEREGYFQTDMRWFAGKLALTALMLVGALLGAAAYVQTGSRFGFAAGAVLLAGFWQQSGFFMHDFMHNQIFHRRRLDQQLGWLFGGVCFGVSGRWWRDEHNEHHLFTNSLISGVGRSDPQMGETIWVQDPKLFEFFARPVLRLLLKVQHIIFLPILIFVGPFGIKIDTIVSENRPSEFAAIGLHWLWVAALVSRFPSWLEGGLFYYVASCCTGAAAAAAACRAPMATPVRSNHEYHLSPLLCNQVNHT